MERTDEMTAWQGQLEIIVPPEQGDQPLRTLLEQTWWLPHRFVHYLRVRRQVLVNGQYQSMNQRVAAGAHVRLQFNGDEFRTATSNYLPTPNAQPTILFENRDVLVINKPAGQKSHPNQPGETGTALNAVAGYLANQPQTGAFMVHRLDQATSGAMLVAKNPVVVPILDRYLSAGLMHRAYVAVVAGHFPTPRGELTWPIGRDPRDRRKRQVNGVNAQPAQTTYQVVATTATTSLVYLTLHTGRTHQLRVHLAYSGHPIVGDPLYAPGGGPRMLLHGVKQDLVLPFSKQKLTIWAPLPTAFPPDLVKLWQPK